MKKIYILLIALTGLTFAACDDFLTELPTDSVADDVAFNAATDYSNNLNGLYNAFGSYAFYGRNIVCLGDAASDVAYHDNKSGNFQVMSMWQITDTESEMRSMWEYGYKVINGAAKIIKASQEADFPESEMLIVYKAVAQAYGLKAAAAFALTNMFALPYSESTKSSLGIVNVDDPIEAFQEISRNTLEQNYEMILSDIAKAKEYFAKPDVDNPGYAYINPVALDALEAKVKLYRKDYAGAITAATAAINARGGSLTTTSDDYAAMYLNNTINSEDIFVVVKSATDNPGAASLGTMYPFYGLHIEDAVLAEYSETDIRIDLLTATGNHGKYAGTSEGSDAHNIPVLRLPELYLTLAESYAYQSNYKSAKENLVTLLSARDPEFDASSVKEDASIIPIIQNARKLELVQEGHRLFDARRWGLKIDVVHGRYKNFDPSLFCYPIPQYEINAGFGVEQTAGWEQYLPK
ncbi:MAG: RagB/SusD family nutrient uptake outer membrane protein [Tannerella sp.]|jgi:hypothetical protein|nr:RagB/SusD family nutrient uptake outer membrane protein [Tannerella sp.]